jgi:hypothetical protein
MTRWFNKKNRKVSGFGCSPFLVLEDVINLKIKDSE